jgi:hypothetical protein
LDCAETVGDGDQPKQWCAYQHVERVLTRHAKVANLMDGFYNRNGETY